MTTTPDLFELYEAREYEKIEAILDSSEYTREEKITMITDKFFARLFFKPIAIELSIKVLRIFGENLGNYVDELKNIVTKWNRNVEDQEMLFRVIVEELSDFHFTDVLTSLLVHSFRTNSVAIVNVFLSSESVKQNILKTKKSIKYKYDTSTKQTKEIFLCKDDILIRSRGTKDVCYKHGTLLEIALQKHVDLQIIRALVQEGGKNLLLLSKRSLIQGAILEYNNTRNGANVAVECVKLFLEVGGKELLMTKKSWYKPNSYILTDVFKYLSFKKEILCESTDYVNIGEDGIVKVMNMLLDAGGKDLVMKKNKKGQTILHYFKYYDCNPFISVVERIKRVGGMELLRSKDNNGETVLHTLAKYYPQDNSDDVVDLEWWEILACDRDLVMMQNKDRKTALHLACENSEVNAIKVLVEKGGKDLVWKRDNEWNTALHFLSFRVSRGKDTNNFQALKHIVEDGGMELLHSLNNKEKKPLTPFLIKALEFSHAKVKARQENTELDKKAKLDLEKQLQAIQKKNEHLELQLKQNSENELEDEVESLKNMLKDQTENNEILNDTIKELQKEKESKIIENLSKNEIKQLQGIEQSL